MADQYPIQWELESIAPCDSIQDFPNTIQQLGTHLKQLASNSEALPELSANTTTISSWVTLLTTLEVVQAELSDAESYVGCLAAADAANKTYQRYEAELSALHPLLIQTMTNVELLVQQTTTEQLAKVIEADEWLKERAFFLEECQRNAQHRLPKEKEFLAADLAVDGIHAWSRLYDRLSGALRISVMERGEVVEKSPSQVQFDSPQRAVRENNFFAANKAWSTLADTCADALNHLSGTRLTIYRHLGGKDHLEAPLRFNRMTRKTLDTMWATITAQKSALVPYLIAKAKLLGQEQLSWYDLTAPLPQTAAATNAEISYDNACNMIFDAFDQFSPHMGQFAKDAVNNGWIEAENRPGKRQGGFCTGMAPKKQSRIFMTYTDTADSMSTLAHELGHAYHSAVLVDQPLCFQDYPMNLAETASTFAEAVLGEARLNNTNSADEQRVILDNMLGDSVSYLMNIHTRFLFEDAFHKERANGELPAERFSELMLAAQKEAYLDQLADDGWYPDFWISKLHFYMSGWPFYNFPYTFGYLLSLGLYALADEYGDEFPERYRRFLVATGNQQTEEAVETAFGYDLTEPTFWEKSLAIVAGRVERFTGLVDA